MWDFLPSSFTGDCDVTYAHPKNPWLYFDEMSPGTDNQLAYSDIADLRKFVKIGNDCPAPAPNSAHPGFIFKRPVASLGVKLTEISTQPKVLWDAVYNQTDGGPNRLLPDAVASSGKVRTMLPICAKSQAELMSKKFRLELQEIPKTGDHRFHDFLGNYILKARPLGDHFVPLSEISSHLKAKIKNGEELQLRYFPVAFRNFQMTGIPDLYIDGLRVPFPYETIYPEQVRYMHSLKRAIDMKGQGMLEMPTGTGKTVSVFALICAYQRAKPEMGKLIFCTRTVPEMTKALRELRGVIEYQDRVFSQPRKFVAIGLSARKNLCVNEQVAGLAEADALNAKCRSLTMVDIEDAGGCSFYKNYRKSEDLEISGIFTIDDLKSLGIQQGWCPYYMSRKFLLKADVVVFSYQYLLDARVAASAPIFGTEFARRAAEAAGLPGTDAYDPGVVVFDEAHNIDEVCIESLTVRMNKYKLDAASENIKSLGIAVKEAKRINADALKNEVEQLLAVGVGSGRITAEAAEGIKVNPMELLSPEQQATIIPGSIRKAENFLTQLQSVVAFLKTYIRVDKARVEGPLMFMHKLEEAERLDVRSL